MFSKSPFGELFGSFGCFSCLGIRGLGCSSIPLCFRGTTSCAKGRLAVLYNATFERGKWWNRTASNEDSEHYRTCTWQPQISLFSVTICDLLAASLTLPLWLVISWKPWRNSRLKLQGPTFPMLDLNVVKHLLHTCHHILTTKFQSASFLDPASTWCQTIQTELLGVLNLQPPRP